MHQVCCIVNKTILNWRLLYCDSLLTNVTNINSTLIFCRASADEFNYSSNPTFRDASGNIVVIDAGDDTGQRSFSFITTVGLYNSNNDLLAVAKLSRPIEKNDEKDLTIRVRLDFWAVCNVKWQSYLYQKTTLILPLWSFIQRGNFRHLQAV